MGFVPEGFSKEIFVDLFHIGVLMRFANGHSHIFLVNRLFTLRTDITVGRDGLTAAAEASARAGHDLYEVVIGFTVSYILHDLLCISQAVGDCAFQLNAFKEFEFGQRFCDL